MPERLAARRGPGEVGAEKVAPGLVALAGGDPGIAVHLDLRGRQPVVATTRRHVRDGARHAVRDDQVAVVDAADRVDAELHLPVEIVPLELQPVEALGIRCYLPRRLDVLPFGIAEAVPGPCEVIERAILGLEPLPEGGNGEGVVVHVRRIVAFVPDVVAKYPRMVAVACGESFQEGAGSLLDLRAVHRQRAGTAAIGGETAGGGRHAHDRRQRRAVGAQLACMGELADGPVGHGVRELGDDGLDAVLGSEIELAIVLLPVVATGRALDGAPHEPVPEDVEPVLGGGAVVAGPVLARRVGLAEIDGAEGHLQAGPVHVAFPPWLGIVKRRTSSDAACACGADRGSAPPRSGCGYRAAVDRCRSARHCPARRSGRDA